MHPYAAEARAYQRTVVGNGGASSFAPPAGARGFYVSVETAGIFLALDGTTATATNGVWIPHNLGPIYIPLAGKTLSAIGSAASCPTHIQWVA